MFYQQIIKSTKDALPIIILILKLVIPFYILGNLLIYFELLPIIAAWFEPLTKILDLPSSTSIALAAGIFINLYAAIAFAAPLGLSGYEWTILGIFLGVAHNMIVECLIIKKLGIALWYSVPLRIIIAYIAVLPVLFMPKSWFRSEPLLLMNFEQKSYDNLNDLILSSLYEASILAIQVVFLVWLIIIAIDFVKNTQWMISYQKKVDSAFSIFVGLILGLTYGSGILIKEAKAGHMAKSQIFFVATFLMICHAVIEDPMLFVIMGASFWVLIINRLVLAVIVSFIAVKIYKILVKD